ncbi:MAG: NUDIX hydrolase [Phycisphaerae bacterium]|jgi:ADP-ribose pyrophosphatase|nr:NUDIX hydrolase [Phycisphaerae bacterium]
MVPIEIDGEVIEKEVVVHGGAVVILPFLTDDTLVLIKNERLAVGRELWELPAGTLGDGETPKICAHRELQEETGYRADDMEYLGQVFSSPGWSTHRLFVFVARGLTRGEQNLEKDETISVETRSFDRVRSMIAGNEIVDSKTIAVFGLYSARHGVFEIGCSDIDD